MEAWVAASTRVAKRFKTATFSLLIILTNWPTSDLMSKSNWKSTAVLQFFHPCQRLLRNKLLNWISSYISLTLLCVNVSLCCIPLQHHRSGQKLKPDFNLHSAYVLLHAYTLRFLPDVQLHHQLDACWKVSILKVHFEFEAVKWKARRGSCKDLWKEGIFWRTNLGRGRVVFKF